MASRWKHKPEGSNWGEFGDDDRIGRMNLLTPERVRRAVQEVREGLVLSLSLPLDLPGGESSIGRQPPKLVASSEYGCACNFHRSFSKMVAGATGYVCDDAVTLHTQYSTQWDGLGHVGVAFDSQGTGTEEIVYYNGYRAGIDVQAPTEDGGLPSNALGIDQMAQAGTQGRGVLVNLHASYGNSRVAVGYEALMECLRRQGAEVLPGDFLCVYTGYSDLLLQMNGRPDHEVLKRSCAALDGSDPRLQQWITDSRIVAICADNNAVEIIERASFSADQPKPFLPLHEHCLFRLGVHLGELWYLRELASRLEQLGRSSFLLTAPPLRLPGASGSPVTPLATF